MEELTYSYDRRSRGDARRIVKDLVRFVKMHTGRAWTIFAHGDGPPVEYTLMVYGKGVYSLSDRIRGREIIPKTKDASKLLRYLGAYDELDWDLSKLKPKPEETKSWWRGLWA